MDKQSVKRIDAIYKDVESMRVELENMVSEEQKAFDNLPYVTKTISSEVPKRIDAINEAIDKLIEAEEALEVARNHEYSSGDMRMESERPTDS